MNDANTRMVRRYNNLSGWHEIEVCTVNGREELVHKFEDRKCIAGQPIRTRAKVGWRFYWLTPLTFLDSGERILVTSGELSKSRRKIS